MHTFAPDFSAFQRALDKLPKGGETIRLESLGRDRLQFHWRELCVQASYSDLAKVLERNQEFTADASRQYIVLAKHVSTQFTMQDVKLVGEVPCEEV